MFPTIGFWNEVWILVLSWISAILNMEQWISLAQSAIIFGSVKKNGKGRAGEDDRAHLNTFVICYLIYNGTVAFRAPLKWAVVFEFRYWHHWRVCIETKRCEELKSVQKCLFYSFNAVARYHWSSWSRDDYSITIYLYLLVVTSWSRLNYVLYILDELAL